jgi:hypothetical protein
MPWDATELRVTTVDATDPKSSDHELIAGADGDTSIIQPLWHPQTGDLYYISDQSGYYNIYRAGYDKSILPKDSDFGGAAPGWSLGQQGFGFLPDGRLVAQYKKDGSSVLLVASVSGDGPATDIQEYGINDGLPMQFGGVIGTESNDLYFIGGSPSTPQSVYKWNLEKKGPADILACSSSLSFSDVLISVPKQIEFPTTLGTAYGYYYAPKNGGFKCTTKKRPHCWSRHMEAPPPAQVPPAMPEFNFGRLVDLWRADPSRGGVVLASRICVSYRDVANRNF